MQLKHYLWQSCMGDEFELFVAAPQVWELNSHVNDNYKTVDFLSVHCFVFHSF